MPNLDRMLRRLDPKRAKRWARILNTDGAQYSPKRKSAKPPPEPPAPPRIATLPTVKPPKAVKPAKSAAAPAKTRKRAKLTAKPAPAATAPRRGRQTIEQQKAEFAASLLRPALIPAAEAAAILPQGRFEPVDPDTVPRPAPPARTPRCFRSELTAETKELVPVHEPRMSKRRIFARFEQTAREALEFMPVPEAFDQRNQRAERMTVKPTRRQLADLYAHFSKA